MGPLSVTQLSACGSSISHSGLSPLGCRGADRLRAPAELPGSLRLAAHLCATNSRRQD